MLWLNKSIGFATQNKLFCWFKPLSHDSEYGAFALPSAITAYLKEPVSLFHVRVLPRTSYIDGAWNQDDPEKWLSVIQIPIE